MYTMTRFNWLAIACCSALLAGCGATNEQAGTAEAEPAGGAITLWTDSTELFMEHPALIVGRPEKFAVHLTDITDFAPLRSGRITLRFTPGDGGAAVVAVQDTPRAPGIYGPAPEFQRPGRYDLTIEVESPQARDVIHVGELQVYATVEDAPKEEAAAESGISFLKEQQWKTPGFRTVFVRPGNVQEMFAATGEIVPAAGRYAQVAAPIGGLVDASDVATSPAPGQRVARGVLLALLTPTIAEAGGGSAYASARRELREAEDEYERAKRLYAAEAIPERRLHEAEIRVTSAREALAGLAASDAITADGKIAVRAPINGVVGERFITPGSRVDQGAQLFTIVDPSIVWLRVNVPAGQAAQVSRNAAASFRLAGLEQEYASRRTISIGSVVDPITRTVPVIYEVVNTDGSIRIGAIASAAVPSARRAQGIVIPTSAILEEDGRPIAYVQTEGETFERRELTLGGRGRAVTLVRAGISDGERVVSGAAYQVRLASLSTAVPVHGHEH